MNEEDQAVEEVEVPEFVEPYAECDKCHKPLVVGDEIDINYDHIDCGT